MEETNAASVVNEGPEVVIVSDGEVVETTLLTALLKACDVRVADSGVTAAEVIELLGDAVQRLRELRAAIDEADFPSKKAAKEGFAEYREMFLRLRGVVNAMRMEALEVRDEMLDRVGDAKKLGNLDVAERKMRESVLALACMKVAQGRELNAFEQEVYDSRPVLEVDGCTEDTEGSEE